MPIFQVTYKANDRTLTSDYESSSKDNILQLFKKLSIATVVSIKRYVYKNQGSKYFKINNKSATVYLRYNNKPTFVIKLPNIKKSINENDIKLHISTLYRGYKSIDIKITFS